jgi:aminoglycoside phosphotransferase (APT) family kinase protein
VNPWDAEVVVSTALAAGLIRRQFPELPGEVRLLGTGWDNDVFAVGDDLAFRFPRRSAALPLQHRELLVLPLVLPLVAGLGLAVPSPVYFGIPDDTYPWPFWGGPLVPGEELCRLAVDRTALGASLGAFLRALHALPAGELPALEGLPVDPMRRADPGHRAAMARTALTSLAALGLVHEPPYPLLEQAGDVGPDGTLVLVHGDLHLRHVLADATGRATGVIDWGDSCLGDPAIDVSFAFGALDG